MSWIEEYRREGRLEGRCLCGAVEIVVLGTNVGGMVHWNEKALLLRSPLYSVKCQRKKRGIGGCGRKKAVVAGWSCAPAGRQ